MIKRIIEPLRDGVAQRSLARAGGAKNNWEGAMHHVRVFFRMMNATGYEEHAAMSLRTDFLPAAEDGAALAAAANLAKWLEE